MCLSRYRHRWVGYETKGGSADFIGLSWAVLCGGHLAAAYFDTAAQPVRLRRSDDAGGLFCFGSVSAAGCPKAGGPSQSDRFHGMGYASARRCNGGAGCSVETIAVRTASVDFSCGSLCSVDRLPPKQREAVSERELRESAIGIERS